MNDTQPASVMCTLCNMVGTVDVRKPESTASAAAWAVHFAVDHPHYSQRCEPIPRDPAMNGRLHELAPWMIRDRNKEVAIGFLTWVGITASILYFVYGIRTRGR